MISIIIPSYGRADKALRVWADASANTLGEVEIIFVVEEEQLGEYDAALFGTDAYVFANERTKNYAGAVNSAMRCAIGDYIFLAADDLRFHHGWNIPCMHTMLALPNVKVVGTNDLLNGYVLNGWHATHYLIDRRYLDDPGGVVDGDPGHVLFEGYDHNYTDTEFIGTAKARAAFAPCLSSVVEHMHPSVGKGEHDSTFEKTQANLSTDCDLYFSRRHLWWDLSK